MAFKGELMLLSWSESSTRGRTVTFLIDETEDEHPFKHYTIKSGKRAGQRFAAMMVQIDDGEQPMPEEPKPSQVAAVIGKDPQFWRYASERGFDLVRNEEEARSWITSLLQIKSRSEIDKDDSLARAFEQRIVQPFNEYRSTVNSVL